MLKKLLCNITNHNCIMICIVYFNNYMEIKYGKEKM